MAITAKTIIGGKKKKNEKVETKAKPKKDVKVTKKETKKPEPNKAKTASRGRKSGVRNEVKGIYSKKLTSLFEECETALGQVQEPLSLFIEKGNKKAAKESRTILAELKKKCIELWRLVHTAKSDMKEVPIK